MDGIKDALSNKYVIIGGVAIGAIILAANLFQSHTGSSGSGQAYNNSVVSGNSPYTAAAMTYNMAAAQEVTKQAAIAGQVAMARSGNDVQLKIATLNTVQAFDTNQASVTKQSLISEQGIIQAQLQAQSAVAIDYSNNAARMYEAQQQTTQTVVATNGSVAIAQAQASAAKKAAKWGALGSVVGSVGKTVAAFA
jgi:hypothetical protein